MTKQNTHHLSHTELIEHASKLEHENQKLRRAGDMLTAISELVRNVGGNSTLEAVARLRGLAIMQQACSFMALNSLEFDAGEWGPEKQVRHLREQIELAKKHLLKADTVDSELDEFVVAAGDKNEYSYTKLHYSFSEALADYMENRHQPRCKIRYKGVDLVVSGGDQ